MDNCQLNTLYIFSEYLLNMEINDTSFPVYTNFSSEPVSHKAEIQLALLNQIENPVLWHDIIKRMIEDGISTAVEIPVSYTHLTLPTILLV